MAGKKRPTADGAEAERAISVPKVPGIHQLMLLNRALAQFNYSADYSGGYIFFNWIKIKTDGLEKD